MRTNLEGNSMKDGNLGKPNLDFRRQNPRELAFPRAS